MRPINGGHTRVGAGIECVLGAAASIAHNVACCIVARPPAINAGQILSRHEDRDRSILTANMSRLLQRRTNARIQLPSRLVVWRHDDRAEVRSSNRVIRKSSN